LCSLVGVHIGQLLLGRESPRDRPARWDGAPPPCTEVQVAEDDRFPRSWSPEDLPASRCLSKDVVTTGRPPAYGFFLPQEGGKSHFSAAGDTRTKNILNFKKAKNSRNLTREQALVSASASRHPRRCLSRIRRWEAPSLLRVFFLGGGTLRLAAR
jgi:hypothetical protein